TCRCRASTSARPAPRSTPTPALTSFRWAPAWRSENVTFDSCKGLRRSRRSPFFLVLPRRASTGLEEGHAGFGWDVDALAALLAGGFFQHVDVGPAQVVVRSAKALGHDAVGLVGALGALDLGLGGQLGGVEGGLGLEHPDAAILDRLLIGRLAGHLLGIDI